MNGFGDLKLYMEEKDWLYVLLFHLDILLIRWLFKMSNQLSFLDEAGGSISLDGSLCEMLRGRNKLGVVQVCTHLYVRCSDEKWNWE